MTGVSVRAQSWSWRFGTRANPVPRDISLEIAAGERVLLTGPSGSGKSTFLAACAGVLGDDQGIAHGDLLIAGLGPSPHRGLTGLVLQDPESQTIRETVGDDVAFGCENLGVPRDEIWRRVDEALDDVGLPLARDYPTRRLSGGQKQRLAIAGVMAMRPGLLLLDEPTANLDPDGAASVVRAVARSAQRSGCTLIVVDHNVQLWRDVLTRVIRLDGSGTVHSDGANWPTPRRFLSGRAPIADGPPDLGGVSGTGSPLVTRGLVVARHRASGIGIPDFSAPPGALTVVTGANGSGKTTLALTLGGLLQAKAGVVNLGEEVNVGIPMHQRDKPWRWSPRCLARRIGNVFQSPEYQFVRPTVRNEISWGLRLGSPSRMPGGRANLTRRVDEVLQRLGLDGLAEAHPYTLSGGQQRRLSLAAVLASKPPLVIADEPTFGQDQESWVEAVTMLRDCVSAGGTVIVATHDRDLVALADEVVTLAGSTVDEGESVR